MSRTLGKAVREPKDGGSLYKGRLSSNKHTETRTKSPNRKSATTNVKTLLKNRVKEDQKGREMAPKSKDRAKARKDEKSAQKTKKLQRDSEKKKDASVAKKGRIVVNLPAEHRQSEARGKSGRGCKHKACDSDELHGDPEKEAKKQKDLEREIKELKKRLKKYKVVKEDKPVRPAQNGAKNKVICISTNYASNDRSTVNPSTKGNGRAQLLDSRKKSVNSVKTPNVPRETSLQRKPKIKAERPKPSLVNAKHKNSLKDLFEHYNKLKDPGAAKNGAIDPGKLKRLKLRIADMYKAVDERLKVIKEERPRKKVIDKKLLQRRNKAAVTIQKVVRGYLVRKIIWNLMINPNPTFNTIEELPQADTQVTVVSDRPSLSRKSSPDNKTAKKTPVSMDKRRNTMPSCAVIGDQAEKRQSEVQKVEHAIQTEHSSPKPQAQYSNSLSRFIQTEYQNWTRLDTIISQINNAMQRNRNNTQTFEDLFSQIKEITTQNMTKLKNSRAGESERRRSVKKPSSPGAENHPQEAELQVKVVSRQDSSKSLQKTYSKAEMDVWPVSKQSASNLMIPLNGQNQRSQEEDRFFYTERNVKNSSKVLSQYGETISRDISKLSIEERGPSQVVRKTSKPRLAAEANDLAGPPSKPRANDNNYVLLQNNDETLKKSLALQTSKELHNSMSLQDHGRLARATDAEPWGRDKAAKNKSDVADATKELKNCPSDLELIEVSFDYLAMSQKLNDTRVADLVLDSIVEDLLGDSLWCDILYKGIGDAQGCAEDEDAIYGIRTNINAVCEYFNMLIKFIGERYLDDIGTKIIKLKLNEDAFERTRQGDTDQNEAVGSGNGKGLRVWERRSDGRSILTEKTYLELEAQILDNYKDMNIMDSLFDMQRVYHRCLFDAFNEVLTGVVFGRRNYGLSASELKIVNKEVNSENELLFILQRAKMILLEYTMYLCGLIRDKEDSMMGVSLKHFDFESINQIREEKLFSMVAKDFKEAYSAKEADRTFKATTEHLGGMVARSIEDALVDDVIADFLG